jgi:WD40 repeat protein
LRHAAAVRYAAFRPDGRQVVAAGNDHLVRLWEIAPEGQTPSPAARDLVKKTVAREPARWLSADGRLEAVPREDHRVQVRNVETGEPLGPPLRHGSTVLYAAFSADGTRLVTASDDNTARVWDLSTGELLAPSLKHDSSVCYAAFSPDARLVVTVGDDQTARAWDAATGQPVTPPLRLAGAVRDASFNADATRLSATGTDGTVSTWDLRPDDRSPADLLNLAGVLAGSRIDPLRGLLPLEPDSLREMWQRLRPESLLPP